MGGGTWDGEAAGLLQSGLMDEPLRGAGAAVHASRGQSQTLSQTPPIPLSSPSQWMEGTASGLPGRANAVQGRCAT